VTRAREEKSTGRVPIRAQVRAALQRKDATTLVNFGSRLRDGHGLTRDLKLARKCFESAVPLDEPTAMTSLARLLLESPAAAGDHNRALGLLRRAWRRGEWSALHFLGRAAEDSGDWRQAERWYRRALMGGDLASGSRLAARYLGRLDEKSHRRGVEILRRSAARSIVEPDPIYLELGKCYLYGRGVSPSPRRAARYLGLAARSEPEAKRLLHRLQILSRGGRPRRQGRTAR
jgi:TPR repeat protein